MSTVFKFLHVCVQSVPNALVYTTFRTLRACKTFVFRFSCCGLCVGSSWRRTHQHNPTNHTYFCRDFSIFENGENDTKCILMYKICCYLYPILGTCMHSFKRVHSPYFGLETRIFEQKILIIRHFFS